MLQIPHLPSENLASAMKLDKKTKHIYRQEVVQSEIIISYSDYWKPFSDAHTQSKQSIDQSKLNNKTNNNVKRSNQRSKE